MPEVVLKIVLPYAEQEGRAHAALSIHQTPSTVLGNSHGRVASLCWHVIIPHTPQNHTGTVLLCDIGGFMQSTVWNH